MSKKSFEIAGHYYPYNLIASFGGNLFVGGKELVIYFKNGYKKKFEASDDDEFKKLTFMGYREVKEEDKK